MKKILVVEDSSTMRLFIRMFLRSISDVRITEATDGQDGLEKLGKESFDLVITDVNMPRLDGLQLIERIRGSLGLKMPIIILTTRGEKENVEKGISLGANNYVTKPIVGPTLTNLVMDYIQVAV
ncbi:MAG: response regulator [Thermodesulfovibrionales bacterium]|nr:response regulator [Thermodesulfovibrionales bacterium]MDP3112862.1 response regulator [Thermodesulfovibrionales bacterium]